MPQQNNIAVDNNFSQGFKTEFTGLNFPENAVTDTINCVFNRLGNVERRPGINYELHKHLNPIDRTDRAITTYVWKNAGGDGTTQILAMQVGDTVYFVKTSAATVASPASNQILASRITLSDYLVPGWIAIDSSVECQFTDGNGYLIILHNQLTPIYCTFAADIVVGTTITVQIRDLLGIPEPGIADTYRPLTGQLSSEHLYNIRNQGWTDTPSVSTTSSSTVTVGTGHKTFTIPSGLSITGGDPIAIYGRSTGFNNSTPAMTGTAFSYSGTTLVVNVTNEDLTVDGLSGSSWAIDKYSSGLISTWLSAESNYPSNSDVWWNYKNASDVFAPATTYSNVTISSGPAPKGHFVIDAFTQDRTIVSGSFGLNVQATLSRPTTGCWFQGRAWFTGANATFTPSGDMGPYSWTENIYFSQIVTTPDQFGYCYQQNDPTSETLFELLPSDGGIVRIQGSGPITKLFPIQNGLLVFAANGIWFITGSQGIGFRANDYTITKISGIRSLSASSFIDIQGMPAWWNEEGIYMVTSTAAGLQVEPLTFTTIQSFYQDIPFTAKTHARGDYDPLNWEVRWVYKTVEETSTLDRYQFDGVLVFNVATKAFYPWLVSSGGSTPWVHGVNYISTPVITNTTPDPILKYLCSIAGGGTYNFTFAEENDISNFGDWASSTEGNQNFDSYFVTGYKLPGQAQTRFQSNYVVLYINNFDRGNDNMSYRIQGIWDYATDPSTGKYTTAELVTIVTDPALFRTIIKRHRIRGRGLVLQFKIASVDGNPFDILGWSIQEKINQSP